MSQLVFLLLMAGTGLAALFRPWIGVVGAYVVAVLTPQAVWWWHFQDLRPAMYVLAPTLVGFMLLVARQGLAFPAANNKRLWCLLVFWLFLALSYLFGPYVDVVSPFRFTSPDWGFDNFNKILLLCVLAFCCIDSMKKLKAMVGVLLVSGLYLTWWATDRYLSGAYLASSTFGRMQGPVDIFGAGIYADENSFGMLFVVAAPFFWFAGHATKNILLRWGLWMAVPLAWHAVFLTASRAALLGVGVTTLLIALRSKSKLLGAAMMVGLVVAFMWQAGDVMKERATTITDSSETSSASRLQAWEAALGMIAGNPLFGVGLNSFGPAFPDYSDKRPREAHNAFLQITAEAGVVAGSMYALIILTSILGLWRNGKRLKQLASADNEQLYYINEAALVSFVGLIVCAMFASLQMYEIFYFFIALINAVLYIGTRVIIAAGVADEQRAPAPLQAEFGANPMLRTRR